MTISPIDKNRRCREELAKWYSHSTATNRPRRRDELALIETSLAKVATVDATDVRAALAVFEFSQNVPDLWRGSKMLEKRRILETLSLNRMLGDVTLVLEKRKPFDELAKRLEIQLSREEAHIFEQLDALATTCVRAYPPNRPPQLRFLARLVNEPIEA